MEFEKVIKQSKFKDGYHKAVVNLLYTANFFRDAHLKIFSEFGIQSQHYNVLRILKGQYPSSVSPGYIKEVMIDKGSDLTRLISKLVVLGWVEKNICPENKRKMNISLNQVGVETLQCISHKIEFLDQGLKNLSEEEYQALSQLLDKMRG